MRKLPNLDPLYLLPRRHSALYHKAHIRVQPIAWCISVVDLQLRCRKTAPGYGRNIAPGYGLTPLHSILVAERKPQQHVCGSGNV
jgi:hypothetical protein